MPDGTTAAVMIPELNDETALARKSVRVALKGIPATAFQHPLDRQATENLKKVKGFDWIVGKFIEYGFERIEYITHIGSGIRVGPKQMAMHYAMLRECCETLDIPEPEMYVMEGGVNAFTAGHNHPFIVLETGLLELMDDDETMAVIAHELGHIKCGHAHLRRPMATDRNVLWKRWHASAGALNHCLFVSDLYGFCCVLVRVPNSRTKEKQTCPQSDATLQAVLTATSLERFFISAVIATDGGAAVTAIKANDVPAARRDS
jgi:hypothetical protein